MVQEAMPAEGLRMFTCPTWDASKDSWDEFLRAVEQAYAQHCRGSGRRDEESQGAQDAAPRAQGEALIH